MTKHFQVIVCGARCAGAPLAMLLARKGMRVLLVDRDPLPSDSLNGHLVKPAGTARLAAWGLLDKVLRAGTPALRRRRLEVDTQVVESALDDGSYPMVAPRRSVLDAILLEAAVSAGVQVEDRTTVRGPKWDSGRVSGIRLSGRGGAERVVTAPVVTGADGRHSTIARGVGAEIYDAAPSLTAAYWAYWAGVDHSAVAVRYRGGSMSGVFPTNAGQVLAFVAVPAGDRKRFHGDIAAGYRNALFEFDGVEAMFASATRESRVLGMAHLPNYFRRSHGPGWALAGDAGHHKDPLVARGISDAFRDADALAVAVEDGLAAGPRALDRALASYAAGRDAACAGVYRHNLALAADDHQDPARTLELVRRLSDAEAQADLRFPAPSTHPLVAPLPGAAVPGSPSRLEKQ
jgi:2-polyprenyl-6-methoxyphenol hydroxylase-like FAD-dependent oxidoreductase